MGPCAQSAAVDREETGRSPSAARQWTGEPWKGAAVHRWIRLLGFPLLLVSTLGTARIEAAGCFSYMLEGHDSLQAQKFLSLRGCDARLFELDLGYLFCPDSGVGFGGPLNLILGNCMECNGVWDFWDRGNAGLTENDPWPRNWRFGIYYGDMDDKTDIVCLSNQSWRHSQIYAVGGLDDPTRVFMGVYNIGRDVNVKIPVPRHKARGFAKDLSMDLYMIHCYLSTVSEAYASLSAWGKLETLTGLLTDMSVLDGFPILAKIASPIAGKTDWDFWFRVSVQARLSYEMGVPGQMIQDLFDIPDLDDDHPAAIQMRDECAWFIGPIPTPEEKSTWGGIKILYR
jgi:hypothetical protein